MQKNSNNIDPVIFIDGQEVLIDCICDALLQYRRENDIFEVGDFIFLNVGSRVYKIDHIYKKEVWLDSRKSKLDIINIDDILRHATPKEIAQGYRDE